MGCLNSPDYEMTIPEQNEYYTAPPSTDTEQQSLAGSLTSQPSSSATKSRKPRSERQSRHKWSDEDKKTLMTLYYRSNPSKSGYRRRLHSLWKDVNLFPRTEQQLADQARSIQQNNLVSEARGHDIMIRLHNMIVMSWNVDHLWRLYFATIFRMHPSLRHIKLYIKTYKTCINSDNLFHMSFNFKP